MSDANKTLIGETLQTSYFKSPSSKETLVSTLIHEVVHAYIRYTDNKCLAGHHDDIASNYIIPMAEYLHNYFGIEQKEAAALAWSGISDAAVVKWSLPTHMFSYDSSGNKMTKSEFENISAAYAGNQVYAGDEKKKGKPICD